MRRGQILGFVGVAACLLMLPGVARADDVIDLRRDDIVAVTFNDKISVKDNHRGDRFQVSVADDKRFPRGTVLNGKIVELHGRTDERTAYADLEFSEIVLPDGTHFDLRAVPIPLTKDYVRRTRDGRFEAKKGLRNGDVVAGSTIGGFLLGALIKKPFEGAFVGALAGIVLSESHALDDDVVVKKGTKLGALIEEDVQLNLSAAKEAPSQGKRSGYRIREGGSKGPTEEGADIRIEFKGKALQFDPKNQPYRAGETVMVPVDQTSAQLGLDVSRLEGKSVFVEDDNNSLRMDLDSDQYRLNGKRGTMAHAAIEREGVVYIPIEMFAAIKREPLYVNGTKIDNKT